MYKIILKVLHGEERLSALVIMNIDADVTTAINYDDILQEFAL
jgi:hypothetical protein